MRYRLEHVVKDGCDVINVVREDGVVVTSYWGNTWLELGMCRESRGSRRLVPCVRVFDPNTGKVKYESLLE